MDDKTRTHMVELIAEVDSVSYIMDRLICACIKLGKFDAQIYELQAKQEDGNDEFAKQISVLSEKSKCSNEERHALCNALDAKLKIAIESGEYKFRRDVRTFDTKR